MLKKNMAAQLFICLCMTGIFSLFLALGFVSLADETYQAVDGNQIPEARLQDQLIEYEELGSLVHANNTSVQNYTNSTEKLRQEYTEIRDYLKTEKSTAGAKKKEAGNDGDQETYAEYNNYERVYSASIKGYNKMLERLDTYSSNKDRLSLEKQLTSGAQNLMISYQSAALQREYLSRMEELSKKLYEVTVTKKQAGMATDQAVSAAYSSWLEAQAAYSSIAGTEDNVYQSLCLLLGVEENGSMAVQRIPATDLSRIDAMDPEADTARAISSNPDVISQRHTASGSTSSTNKKLRTLDELEDKITVKMQQLCQAVYQSKTAYDAAATGYSSAQISWNNAQSKYSLGMLSQAEYIQAQIQYLQKKAGYESADLDLLQALETYNWAVNGVMELE